MPQDTATLSVKVWDLPTRLFHWTLLALVVTCWWTAGEDGDIDWHMRCGYAVLALLLFRLVWGVLGSTTARFASFVVSPRKVLGYFADVRANTLPPQLGHNPAGGWMVVALLVLLLGIAGSGLFANDDIMSEGPLAHHVSESMSDLATAWHEGGFYTLLALVALHVSAIVFYLLMKKDNLVRPMLTGSKEMQPGSRLPVLHMRSNWLALLVLGGATGTVWLLVSAT
jgi:cytochrome b